MQKKSHLTIMTIFLVLSFVAAGCGSEPAAVEAPPVDEAAEFPAAEEDQASEEASEEITEEVAEVWESIPCNVAFDSDRDGNWEIYIMGPDGENPANLSNNPADDWDPVFSPDGSRIAFVSNRENEEGGGQFIYIMNADGSNVYQLTFEENCDYPDWSHDGSWIIYTSNDDIYFVPVDSPGSSTRVTESPEKEISPTWSPDGTKIAWLSGDDGNWNVFSAGPEGQDMVQVTDTGTINRLVWTTDGRIFVDSWGWSDKEEFCHNCVVDMNGNDVEDAGGKGEIQRYLPFWNGNSDRVELIEGSLDEGPSEIYLVSEIFEDVFFNMTNNPAWDRHPDWPAKCGPEYVPTESDFIEEEFQVEESQEVESQGEEVQDEEPVAKDPQDIVIGYEGDEENMSEQGLADLLQACDELDIQCVQGDNLTDLTGQGVDAIISFTNIWKARGDSMEINDVAGQGFPIYILNAESDAYGAYNLAFKSGWVHTSLQWMFGQMGGSGEMVYYNFGPNDFIEDVIQEELAANPGIQTTAMPASYDDTSVASQEVIAAMVAEDPDLGAIWTTEMVDDIFWGLNDMPGDQYPAIICEAREGELQAWKDRLAERPEFHCIAVVEPGGTAYEAVYVAYYRLTGMEIDPAALGGEFGNTLLYDGLIITNDNLDEWLGKVGELRMNEWGGLKTNPMTPEEIKDKWFLE